MKTINNKTQNSLAFQHPAVFIANGINNGGGVTSSTHNLTINRKKIRLPIITETKMTAHDWNIYVRKHAFAQMFIKSLKNRYAVTGL